MNLKQIEANTWAGREEPSSTLNSILSLRLSGTRVGLFELMDVPNHQLDQVLFLKQMVEVRNRITTIEILRPFNTLPKWLKKRMKFRLDNRRISNYPELKSFVENLNN